ncbi:MAG: DUF11 domain-containing protein [Alphaproteobacteria bacterium]|nr:DUF11 domain-containing protein [Alphaproteobacteria bacterium]
MPGDSRLKHPGDYATLNSYQPRDGTTHAAGGITSIYAAGYTDSAQSGAYNFPVGAEHGPRGGQSDIYIVKLSTAAPTPQLAMSKTATPTARICVGDSVGYTVTLRNTGAVPLSNVLLVDTFAGGAAIRLDQAPGCSPPNPNAASALVTCPGTGAISLAPGEAREFTFAGTAIGAGTAQNTAIATANDVAPVTQAVNQTVETCTPAQPGISVTKHWSRNAAEVDPALNVGDAFTYTIEVRNIGSVDLTNVQVLDDFNGGGAVRIDPPAASAGCTPSSPDAATALINCTLGSLPAAPSAGAVRQITMPARATSPGMATNTVTVTAAETAPQRIETHQVVVGRADLAVAMETYDQPAIGQPISHLVIVTNAGPDPAASLVVKLSIAGNAAATVPAACASLPSSPGQQDFRCALSGTLDLDPATSAGTTTAFAFSLVPASDGTVQACAEIIERTDDPNPTNNSVCRESIVPAGPPAATQLSISKTTDRSTVRVGDALSYKVAVTNDGNVPLTGIVVQDTFEASPKVMAPDRVEALGGTVCLQVSPSGPTTATFSCSIAELAAGRSAGAILHAHAVGQGAVTNTVTATSTETAPVVASATLSHQVIGSGNADLSIELGASANAIVVNQPFALYMTARNGGPGPASGIRTTLALPPGVTVMSMPQWCVVQTQGAGATLACGTASLAAGAPAVLPIVLRPTDAMPLFFEAEVSSETFDPNQSNNRTTASFSVSPAS